MVNHRSLLLATTLFVAVGSQAYADTYTSSYNFGTSASQFSVTSITQGVEQSAGGGYGVTVAVVDTGFNVASSEYAGRVSSASSCVMTLYRCPATTGQDDNGHGNVVASIIGGTGIGVAQNAKLLSIKVMNSAGTGSGTDLASGITAAANGGAKIINVSATYSPVATLVTAINYAASKGAIVVFAGGNTGTAIGSTATGLTTQALNQLIFVGSLNTNGTLSTFSTTPGTKSVQAGGPTYAQSWISAVGEGYTAPGVNGATLTNQAGTSFAAPVVAGSLALLESTWPILQTNGTAAKLLEATATAKGTAAQYGAGVLNLAQAFQPVGGLTVNGVGGKTYAVSSLTGSVLSGGALGSLSGITAQLSNYTTFDTYARNFNVNLSGLVATKSPTTGAQAASSATAPTVNVAHFALANGGELTAFYPATQENGLPEGARLTADLPTTHEAHPFMFTFSQKDGSVYSLGQGLSGALGFNTALYGANSPVAAQSATLGVSNALTELAQGGMTSAYGQTFGDGRVAFQFSSSDVSIDQANQYWTAPKATAMGIGYTTKLASFWTSGYTFGALNETAGLLGTQYMASGPLSLGDTHHSVSYSTSQAFELNSKTSLLFEGTVAQISGSTPNSLITSVSELTARAYGVSLTQTDFANDGDSVTFSVKKPLRIVSGSANVATSGVDSQGYATSSSVKVGLTPSGNQTDLGVTYATPLTDGVKMNASLTYSSDAQNVHGLTDIGAQVGFNVKF